MSGKLEFNRENAVPIPKNLVDQMSAATNMACRIAAFRLEHWLLKQITVNTWRIVVTRNIAIKAKDWKKIKSCEDSFFMETGRTFEEFAVEVTRKQKEIDAQVVAEFKERMGVCHQNSLKKPKP